MKGTKVSLVDNEYLDAQIEQDGHYGSFYVFDETDTHVLIKHACHMKGTWVDKRAIYKG